jgi:hypothetical protein
MPPTPAAASSSTGRLATALRNGVSTSVGFTPTKARPAFAEGRVLFCERPLAKPSTALVLRIASANI